MTDTSGSPVPASVGDRQAVEYVLGRPLSQAWPPGALAPGSRVRVVRARDWDGPWQVEFTGVIDPMGAPEPNLHAQALDGELAYWVTFDAPQRDSCGDGPYRKAQIWDRYLRAETGGPDTGQGRHPRG
ncbi:MULTISPECIES: ferrous iron transport protein A [Streptomyces]|uniref:ferrous iron transport protein A n=1 Tax=Streptomyces TaxID=1883 RepID=UPI001F40C898|nr:MULTISPECIES: ferrous iron transport protein A [Streptomyces]